MGMGHRSRWSGSVPADHGHALAAAAQFAVNRKTALSLDQIRRVATACQDAPELTLQLLQNGSPAPAAPDIVSALTELGTPYSHLSARAETEFEVPNGDAHEAVFDMLADAACGTPRRNAVGRVLS
jgi:hypothetical protein